jgi:hypothetical protein
MRVCVCVCVDVDVDVCACACVSRARMVSNYRPCERSLALALVRFSASLHHTTLPHLCRSFGWEGRACSTFGVWDIVDTVEKFPAEAWVWVDWRWL